MQMSSCSAVGRGRRRLFTARLPLAAPNIASRTRVSRGTRCWRMLRGPREKDS